MQFPLVTLIYTTSRVMQLFKWMLHWNISNLFFWDFQHKQHLPFQFPFLAVFEFCIFLLALLLKRPSPCIRPSSLVSSAVQGESQCAIQLTHSLWSSHSPGVLCVTVREVLSPSPGEWVLKRLKEYGRGLLLPLSSAIHPPSLPSAPLLLPPIFLSKFV